MGIKELLEIRNKIILEDYKNAFSLYKDQAGKLANIFTIIIFATISFDIQIVPNLADSTLYDCLTILFAPSVALIMLLTSYIISNKFCSESMEEYRNILLSVEDKPELFRQKHKRYLFILRITNLGLFAFSIISVITCALIRYDFISLSFYISLLVSIAGILLVLWVSYVYISQLKAKSN